MRTALIAAAAATTFFAAPALAECVSDINKADAIVQSNVADPYTSEVAEQLLSKAKSQKMNGEFENCNSTTRELKALLGYE